MQDLKLSHKILLGITVIFPIIPALFTETRWVQVLLILSAIAAALLAYVENIEKKRSQAETTKLISKAQHRQKPNWTSYIEANFHAPPTANIIKIQIKLWSTDNTVPLIVKIASSPNGELEQEISGPSAVLEQTLMDNRKLYISFSNEKIEYDISTLGYTDSL